MTARKPTDECLLCRVNAANKTKSHILPRFISTGFLGTKGAPRKGYIFNGQIELTDKPKNVQDSPKEDFILCEECEAYFSLLETASAPSLKFWQDKVEKGHHKIVQMHRHLKFVELASPDPLTMRLLVYSMFWRVAISSLESFKDYMLDPELTESLRGNLLKFKSLSNADLLHNIKTKQITIHPYATMTAESFKDETKNVLAAINSGNPASLHVDKFGFFMFKSEKDILEDIIADFSNFKVEDNQIVILSEEIWEDVMIKRPLTMAVEQAKRNSRPRRVS